MELRRLRREPPHASASRSVSCPTSLAAWACPFTGRHHADGDALTTAQAFIALATHLDAFDPQTVGSLVRVSRPERRPPSPRADCSAD